MIIVRYLKIMNPCLVKSRNWLLQTMLKVATGLDHVKSDHW